MHELPPECRPLLSTEGTACQLDLCSFAVDVPLSLAPIEVCFDVPMTTRADVEHHKRMVALRKQEEQRRVDERLFRLQCVVL